MTLTSRPSIFYCWGSQPKIPQTGWLKPDLFSHHSGGQKSKVSYGQGWLPSEASPGLADATSGGSPLHVQLVPALVTWPQPQQPRSFCLFVLSFFLFLLRAAPVVYGSSQARGQMCLHHSHSHGRLKPHAGPTMQLAATLHP